MANEYVVLVTGANSGLGLSICMRLIDEFLSTRDNSHSLLVIPTTRSRSKCDATVKTLTAHLHKTSQALASESNTQPSILERRVRFLPELVDLCSLHSVRALARRLQNEHNLKKLDVAIFNAGVGGWTGVAFWRAVFSILTEFPAAVTYPTYKLADTGHMLQRQLPLDAKGNPVTEPPTGDIFTANLFGHYLLCRWLAPLLRRGDSAGRVVWMSSIEAYAHTLDARDDFMGVRNPLAYESSKRITDVLAISSRLASTSPWTDSFYAGPRELQKQHQKQGQRDDAGPPPQMYLCQPGIVATGIMPLNWFYSILMLASFWVARWVGSIWHPIAAYKGACAAVWLALAAQDTLDFYERKDGVAKWGSATDRSGEERVERTEVEGWGYGGVVGDASQGGRKRKGRKPGARDLTAEDRVEFEQLGRTCWQEMERIRVAWEEKLDEHGL